MTVMIDDSDLLIFANEVKNRRKILAYW